MLGCIFRATLTSAYRTIAAHSTGTSSTQAFRSSSFSMMCTVAEQETVSSCSSGASDVALVWFKWTDLRLHDHEPLLTAHAKHSQVINLFVIDPFWFGKTREFGFPKTGYWRTKFLLECLVDLRRNLKKHGSNLIIRTGKSEEVIAEIVRRDKVSAVYTHAEVCSEERGIDEKVRKAVEDISWRAIWGNTMYHVEDLPFPKISSFPDVFTMFRRSVEKDGVIRKTLPVPPTLRPCPVPTYTADPGAFPAGTERASGCNNMEGAVPSLGFLGVQAPAFARAVPAEMNAGTIRDEEVARLPQHCQPDCLDFTGGETAGVKRVQDYVWISRHIVRYKETRNALLGQDYSTKFSPWLSFGCISPRYVYEEIQRFEKEVCKNDSTYWVVFELLWRDFFRFSAIKWGNKLFYLRGPRGTATPRAVWSKDTDNFGRWSDGLTGYPFIDANMRELVSTGFMSNRGRQNVASFLIKDMRIDWRMGAEFFESWLIDHDPCSNYGNWTYVAGVGCDPREDRYFLIPKQSRQYDPEGLYMRRWLPELKHCATNQLHDPRKLAPLAKGTYPPPVCSLLADLDTKYSPASSEASKLPAEKVVVDGKGPVVHAAGRSRVQHVAAGHPRTPRR